MVTATERGSGLWLPHTERHPINQLDVGPRGETRGVVLHINEGTFEGTLSWWSRPGNNVGAHIEVGDGRVAQCVALEREAFHAAGANSFTIGIEHAGMHLRSRDQWLNGHHTELALSANRGAWILHEWDLGHPVYGHNVWRHRDFPEGGHPDCPGPHFPLDVWLRLCHDAYYGHWGRR
jgi:N-acetyl-anhydromuramyl-L-alanine amidase AmpD